MSINSLQAHVNKLNLDFVDASKPYRLVIDWFGSKIFLYHVEHDEYSMIGAGSAEHVSQIASNWTRRLVLRKAVARE